ncbi:polyprenyl synthetase family protein [Falsiroseomonas ponticola]|uniref:polyprenyl synthetase family protein n=1 Tax=Falsiroseomonas ponticola TaxID=2786951 RepID=UPI00384CDBAA
MDLSVAPSTTAASDIVRGEDALAALTALVRDDLEACNRLIVERMQSPVALIPQLAAHIVAAGGKRLRPLLTLAAAKLAGYRDGQRHVALAACVEFIHTATLLHDDVVDESALRRGQASANALFGNKPSVLVGDFLFARAFQVMVEDGSLEVLRILSEASATIAEGEVLQLITQNDTATTEAQYLAVIEGKTAALFAAATEVGAIVAACTPAQQQGLRAYGHNLGVAFQLIDDALDYSAKQEALGKTVGDDFREGKITLPVLLAFQRGDEAERAFWRRTLEEREQADEDLARAIALMEKHAAFADTVGRARDYGNAALEALAVFPDGVERRALEGIVEFCISRAR